MATIRIKRLYEPASAEDGFRVLVDRLWPRGVSKERADLGIWLRAIAPSTELRQWYGHDPARYAEFTQRYQHELASNAALPTLLQIVAEHPVVTLLYATKSPENEAAVLQQYLLNAAERDD